MKTKRGTIATKTNRGRTKRTRQRALAGSAVAALAAALIVAAGAGAWDVPGKPSATDAAARAAKCGGLKPTVKGTKADDKLKGTGGDDVISAGPGNDKVNGKGGNDFLCGGPGKDKLKGGPGDDDIFGNGGKDKLDGGPDTDTCDGGPAKNKIKNCEEPGGGPGGGGATNNAPTDIGLSNATLAENEPSGTLVGNLTTVDADAADAHIYSLVTGAGSADNGSFAIAGGQLRTAAVLDFEAKPTYLVRLKTDDGNGGTFEKQFTIAVTDTNDPPSDIGLAGSTVAENEPAGTPVGTLTSIDENPGDTHTYALVAGSGDADNAQFQIVGDQLQTNASLDFEAGASRSVRVRTTDSGTPNLTFDEQFTITLTDVNEAPTDIALSNDSVAENQPAGTTVGNLSTVDPDPADTHTYTLVAGAGDADNASFQIAGNQLQTGASFDFEADSSYSIRVRSADSGTGNLAVEEQFTITITDANDAPSGLALSNTIAIDGDPVGTAIGDFTTTDQDPADTHTYTLVAGAGDGDNASFQIDGDTLENAAVLNAAGSPYSIRVRTTDSGTPSESFEMQFTITVSPPNANPTDIALSNSSVDENLPAGTDVGTLTTTDPDPLDTHTYSLVGGAGSTDNASFQINGSVLELSEDLNFEDGATRDIRLRTTDQNSGFFEEQFTITVNDLNDPPNAVNDTGATDEDTILNVAAPGVLANDTDADPGDTKTVTALNGSGPPLTQNFSNGRSVTINANGSYSFNPGSHYQSLATGQSDTFSFTYTMQDGAGAPSTATVNLTINGVSDAPTAAPDSFDAIGNTGLFVGTTRPANQAGRQISGSLLTNDTDPDTPQASLVAEPVTNAPTTLGGAITIEADGNFTYHPDDGDTGVTDTFTYRVCDASPCNSGTVANATGTLSLPITNQVWYVRNNQPAGGDGTSDTPFDTLSEAETASQTGDTAFVFDGDNTSVNLDTGYAMEANERLIGEVADLVVGADTLWTGIAGNRPTLTASNEDVVAIDDNNVVRALELNPSGTGGGVGGSAGDTGGANVDDLRIIDQGTAGTQPALELDGTTGLFNFSNLTINAGQGVRLNNAGTAQFLATGTVSITASGGFGLQAASTAFGTSTFDDITAAGSGTGGVNLSNTSGNIFFGDNLDTDLALTTTSGATPAFGLASHTGTVLVDASGTENVSATGGPAVSVSGSSNATLFFDNVSSSGSASTGISLTNLPTAFSASGGSLQDATNADMAISGGAGGFTYGGTISDDVGQLVSISGATAGTKDFNGAITDGLDGDGSGISLTGNSGATIRFDGGLGLSTGANPAFAATGGGTVAVTDPNAVGTAPDNTITTTTGTGLNVANTNIDPANLSFRSIDSNGAVSGIALNSTGASGGLNVTGNGGACATTADACSGGTIQATTGDAVSLTSTRATTLQRMKIRNNLGNGVRGSSVTNFALRDSVVDNNGDNAATDEAGLHFTNLAGTSEIVRTLVANSPEDNARVINSAGTLSQLNVTDNTFRDTDTVSPGNNGLLLQADGGSITADVLGNTFLRNRANGLQVITNGTGSMDVEVDDGTGASTFDDNNIGVSIAHNSSGIFSYGVRDLTIDGLNVAPGTGGSASPININLASAATTPMVGHVVRNTVTNSNSTTGPGLRFTGNGSATMTANISNNTVSQVANRGIEVIARDGTNRINATIANNNVTLNNALSADAIRVDAGTVSTDTTTICADIRGNSASTTAAGLFGIRARQRFLGTTWILEDYAGAPTDDAAVQAFLSATNNGSTTSADHGGPGFTSIADCPNAPAPPP